MIDWQTGPACEMWAVNCDRAGCDVSWLGDGGQPRPEVWSAASDAGWVGVGWAAPHYCPLHADPRPSPETILESSRTETPPD